MGLGIWISTKHLKSILATRHTPAKLTPTNKLTGSSIQETTINLNPNIFTPVLYRVVSLRNCGHPKCSQKHQVFYRQTVGKDLHIEHFFSEGRPYPPPWSELLGINFSSFFRISIQRHVFFQKNGNFWKSSSSPTTGRKTSRFQGKFPTQTGYPKLKIPWLQLAVAEPLKPKRFWQAILWFGLDGMVWPFWSEKRWVIANYQRMVPMESLMK